MSTDSDIRRLKKKKVDTGETPEWADEEIKLNNMAVRPYMGRGDWRSENDEVVVEVITMDQHLFDQWQRQARKTNSVNSHASINGEPAETSDYVEVYTHSDFENNFKGPGIYREGQYLDSPEKVDESYVIILPTNFVTPIMIDNYIEALNEKFDRNLVHEVIDVNSRIKNMHKSGIKNEFDGNKASLDEVMDEVIDKVAKW
mgnify:CR=1 FL=1